MSQEGADDLPREVEWSHDQSTGGPGGSTPAIVGPAIVTPASSNSNSAGELASETDYAGSMPASPVVALHAGEDNDAGPKPASPEVLRAGEDNPTEPKFASPAVLHASEDNDLAGHKLAIQAAMPHASEDNNNAAVSKLTFPVVPCAGGEDTKSKMDSPMMLVSVDDNAGFKLDGPALLDAELASQLAVPHAGEDKDKNVSPAMINAGEDDDNKAGSKLSIQETPHAVEDDIAESNSKLAGAAALQDGEGNSAADDDESTELKLSMPAMLHAGEGNNVASKFATEASSPLSSEDNNAGEEGGEANVAAIAGSGGGAPSNTVKDAPAAVVANRGGRGRGRGRGKGKGKSVATAEEKAMHIWTEKERRKKMKTMFGSLHALLPQLPEKADKSTIVGEAVSYIKTLEGTVRSLETLKQERIRAQQVAAGAGCSRAPQPAAAPPPTREAILADMVQSWNAQEDLMAELRAAASAVVVAASAGSSTTSAAAAPAPAAPAPALQTWSGPNIVVCVAGHDAFINICTPRRPGMLTRMLAVLEKHRVGVVTTTVSSDHIHTFFSIQARINAAIPPPPMLPENVTVLDRYKLAVSEMLHAVAN
ncbi:unnamed protein product [Urochloa decumbens]|uniref:BHLH domain-containing protein n=1 Tax=Urochloa decumbens TaxID=240449 RepID=A0ABC9F0V5_9POAL